MSEEGISIRYKPDAEDWDEGESQEVLILLAELAPQPEEK